MKELKTVVKEVVTHFVDVPYPDSYGWPPTCAVILYQPERPVVENSVPSDAEITE